MKIAIVTDSTAYLTPAEAKQNQITIVPMPVIMADQVYQEGVNLSTTEFYQRLRTEPSLPSTSQPPIGELLRLYENLGNDGYDIVLSIHLASTLSGLYGTLKSAASQIKNTKVIPYDSGITVKLMGYLAIYAARLVSAGVDIDEVLSRLDQLKQQINEVFIVNDLKNLVRGGRLSNTSAVIGSMLKVKPLLTFDEHTNQIILFEKIRSLKRAYHRAEEIFEADLDKSTQPLRLIIIHANDEAAALAWQQTILAKHPDLTTEISYFGPVIGTHLGERAIALAWLPDVYQIS
ncbi:DegV family protein [Lapidilactobacillus wuchangensis]|uniref:DegV family protein n=1 Tax=Lapidilactobacillus wuchangensis TaxID=2486001 RepID=UPI000F77F550|nr:DegV family protein [Lapidilactobacillus wuchangensis]